MHVLEEKYVRTLHVSVKDFTTVEGSQTADNLNEYIPNLFLFDVGLALLVVTDFLEDISVIRILHNQA